MESFSFAHMADCHIGSWRDPKLRDFSLRAFKKAIDSSIERKVDFILIAGDLFNTAIPSLDCLKEVVRILKNLQQISLPVYIIAGSHDYSPSGRTMLDILEEAGLLHNVFRGSIENETLTLSFTQDKKTQVSLTGIIGRKGTLDRSFYEVLDKKNLESQHGYKIFLLHTSLMELMPNDMKDLDSAPLSFLPKNFNYYAAGHVHIVKEHHSPEFKDVVYPGPLFPNSFPELEKLGGGGFYIVEAKKQGQEWKNTLSFIPIILHPVCSFDIDCNSISAEQAQKKIMEEIRKKDCNNAIVTLRLSGELSQGKPSDLNLLVAIADLYSCGAYVVLKNAYQLTQKEIDFQEMETSSQDRIEENIIRQAIEKFSFSHNTISDKQEFMKSLMQALTKEKAEGETNADFEASLKQDVENVLFK